DAGRNRRGAALALYTAHAPPDIQGSVEHRDPAAGPGDGDRHGGVRGFLEPADPRAEPARRIAAAGRAGRDVEVAGGVQAAGVWAELRHRAAGRGVGTADAGGEGNVSGA